jgi:hypothetical protein
MPKPCYNSPMFNKPNKVNTMRDYLTAIVIGLLLTVGALAYFDILIK